MAIQDNNKSTRTVVVNAAKLDPKTPIPIETEGQGYSYKVWHKYVPFLDKNDNFFQILVEANALSPTNLACTNSKTKFSIGKGWKILQDQEDKELTAWAASVNKRGHSFNDVLKNIFNNRYVVGNSFIEAVRFTVGNEKYFHLYRRNFLDCRLMVDEDTDLPTHVVISKKFRKKGSWNITENDSVQIPIYNGDPKQEWFKNEKKGTEHLMFHIKCEASGYDQYGMPSNHACLPEQILEYKMARYNMDNFDNNLVIGGLIVLQGNFTPDESKKVANEITKAHTGDGKRGKYVVLASETGIDNSKVINFDQNKEYDYINGDRRIEEKILLTNEWSKVLIDPQAGSMGNSGKQIRELYETKMNLVIGPEQAEVIEKFIKPVMKVAGAWLGKKWGTYDFGFLSLPILGISSEIDVNAVLTVDEGRAALGYAPHKDATTGAQRIKTSTQNTTNNVPN